MSCYEPIRTNHIKPNLSVGEKLTATITINDALFGYKVFKGGKLVLKYRKLIFKEDNIKYKMFLKKYPSTRASL
jgi:hypothetical protein